MTKKRTQYLYKFTGFILKKYQKKSPKYQQYFYQLKVNLANSALTKLFAFQKKAKSAVWNALESDAFIGKKYLFSCRNFQGSYHLVDWEEVKSE